MDPVAPAFPSSASRLVFAGAVLALLALPGLLHARGHPSVEERFRSVPQTGGDFAAIEHFVLHEAEPIDILVLGTSYLWAAIDTPLLEERVGEALGRPAVARTLGSNFRGEEMYTVLLDETLRRRKVRVLVLSMPSERDRRDSPHPYAHRVAGPGFLDLYDGLPLRQRGAALGEVLLGAPRHALALVRGERTEVSPLLRTNGALLRREGFSGAAFDEDLRPAPELPVSSLVYGPASRDRFCFLDDALNEIQLHFTRQTIALAQKNGVRVVILNVPTWSDRTPNPGIIERRAWRDCVRERMVYPETFPGTTLVGATPRDLFGEMTEREAQRFFYSGHMNANGARYFTDAIAPALVEAVR
jgi:hypothetical protein